MTSNEQLVGTCVPTDRPRACPKKPSLKSWECTVPTWEDWSEENGTLPSGAWSAWQSGWVWR